jgi:membrane protein implicated in regulation of membrane protease activity
MAWWILVAAGVLLVVSELFIGAFIVLWFGIGAIVTGLLTLVVPDMHVGIQLLIIALSGTVLMLLLRDRYVAKGNADPNGLYTFSAGEGKLTVGSDGAFRVAARGTYWMVANPEVIPEDKRTDGVIVHIERFEENMAVLRGE